MTKYDRVWLRASLFFHVYTHVYMIFCYLHGPGVLCFSFVPSYRALDDVSKHLDKTSIFPFNISFYLSLW